MVVLIRLIKWFLARFLTSIWVAPHPAFSAEQQQSAGLLSEAGWKNGLQKDR